MEVKVKVMRFNKRFFFIASLLFITEVIIALYVKDNFVRPYVGDYLVIILIYTAIRSIFKVRKIPLAIGILIFAYVVEFSQYFNLIGLLHYSGDKFAQNILGSSFAWSDIIAYTLGIITVMNLEKLLCKKRN